MTSGQFSHCNDNAAYVALNPQAMMASWKTEVDQIAGFENEVKKVNINFCSYDKLSLT
jgi:hypothetical protein